MLTEHQRQNDVGVWEPYYTKRKVFANVQSVSRAEFFDGGRNGLNPEFQMTMFAGDYHGERVLEYNWQNYAIYRTYQRRNDEVELYVERKGGDNG